MGQKELPRLRTDLEYIRTIYQGHEALVIKDPVGLIKKPHIYGSSVKIVPIFVGSFHDFFLSKGEIRDIPDLEKWTRKFKDIYTRYRQESLIVAGVEFSHVGLKFDHQLPGEALLSQAKSHDEKLIEVILERNAQKFWLINQKVEDRYNVCGFSTIILFLQILPESKGKLIDYQYWVDEPTNSAVSSAFLVFLKERRKNEFCFLQERNG